MTGYQETLTDPSYHRQVVVQTAPHIGNTGVNDEDDESGRIWVAGYVVRDPARVAVELARHRRRWRTGWRAEGVVGISGIDTRALTRHLRERGAMRVGVSSVEHRPGRRCCARVLAAPQMAGADLSAEVTTPQPYTVAGRGRAPVHGRRARPGHQAQRAAPAGRPRASPPTCCRRRPRWTICSRSAPDAVFFSPGPGDPATADHAGRAGPGGAAPADAAVRHLLRQPDPRPGAGLRHLQARATATAASTSRCWTGPPARSR